MRLFVFVNQTIISLDLSDTIDFGLSPSCFLYILESEQGICGKVSFCQFLIRVIHGSDITHQSLVFGPFHGRSPEQFPIVLNRQLLPLLACHLFQFFPKMEFLFLCRSGETEMRAGSLTAVAAIEAGFHVGGGPLGNFITVLYGEVTQAAACIKSLRGQCPGGTGIEALPAMAAALLLWTVVGINGQGKENLAQKERTSRLGMMSWWLRPIHPRPAFQAQ